MSDHEKRREVPHTLGVMAARAMLAGVDGLMDEARSVFETDPAHAFELYTEARTRIAGALHALGLDQE